MPVEPTMTAIDIGRIFLDLANPRHDPYVSESQVIEYLCRHDNVLPLAKDIAEWGLNPLEILAVIPDDRDQAPVGADRTYIAAEGNRRLCAIKLLDDPERVPNKLRKSFQDLNRGWTGVAKLTCAVFPDRDSVKMWLSRIHEGEQGGVGRKKWDSDQIARHNGESRNRIALAILDYAQDSGFISADDRKGKLTTAQRYLANGSVRTALGLDASDLSAIKRTRPKEIFDKLLNKFLADLSKGHVNSRANKDEHVAYARELDAVQGIDHSAGEVTPLKAGKPVAAPSKPSKPKKVKARRFVPFEDEIMEKLNALKGDKLANLYSSICTVSLDSHTPLVAIGAWAFMESLTAKAGRRVDTDFISFFSKVKLQSYGLPTGKGEKSIGEALRRVSASGDVTKHDANAALFNGEQLINDMETLKNLIEKCAAEAIEK